MTCRAPLEAARHIESSGKPIVYQRNRRPTTLAEGYEALDLPCGQCTSCRLSHSRKWAVRMMHEAAYQEEHGRYSTFITLTYDDTYIPLHATLVKHHVQDFMKRLRRQIAPHKISHYSVGEYGSTCPDHNIVECPMCGALQRPHYHAIIFGWAFPDKQMLGTRNGDPVYESPLLNQVWNKGSHEIGSCTFESCSYVSRYVMKKITGKKAPDHYQRHIPETDQIVQIEPEFALMSRNPAIGRKWYETNWTDVYPSDECPVPGRFNLVKPPRYYDTQYEFMDPKEYEKLKTKRRDAMALSLLTGPSLESRAINEDARLKQLRRTL